MAGSIWKGSISFGLLNIPVTLQKAQEEKELKFSLLDAKDMSPIKYKKINAKSGMEVPWGRIVKGYEFEPGQYVIVNKEDFKAANPKALQTIDIEDFIKFEEIELMFFEKPYYLVPQKNGIKGYYLLCEALKKTNKVAMAKVVIRTKMHLACIMARGNYLVLELLRFAHEVLDLNEVDYMDKIEEPKVSAKEIQMAQQLIEGMTGKWNPEQYKDTYNEDIMKIINLKIKGGEVEEIEDSSLKEEKGDRSNVVDILPLLKKSLEQRKKDKNHSEASIAKKKKKARKFSPKKVS